ncbi:hypothetical protein EJB05_21315, partial [Eragrostis curvula]
MTIQAGKSTALVGQSGFATSFIIGLIVWFYDPLMGVIVIDCRDIERISDTISKPTLEIALRVTPKMTPDVKIEDVVRLANAHKFITNFKDRDATLCGERGFHRSRALQSHVLCRRTLQVH